jgi:hypothetical protein
MPKTENIPQIEYHVNVLTSDEESSNTSFDDDALVQPNEDRADGQIMFYYRKEYLKRNYPDLLKCDWNEGLYCYYNRFNHRRDNCKHKERWFRSEAYAKRKNREIEEYEFLKKEYLRKLAKKKTRCCQFRTQRP